MIYVALSLFKMVHTAVKPFPLPHRAFILPSKPSSNVLPSTEGSVTESLYVEPFYMTQFCCFNLFIQ